MKYIIFQLYSLKAPYAFMSWNFAQEHNFDFRDYVGLHIGEVSYKHSDPQFILESIYLDFNQNIPEGFEGHSLSMSDIVMLEDQFGDKKYFYCDTCGWKEITSSIIQKKEIKPHLHERAELVRAMETVARAINDEDIFMPWLSNGVADGDVKETTTDEELACYCDDDSLSELMGLFLRLMARAKKDGGLQCDRIVSAD